MPRVRDTMRGMMKPSPLFCGWGLLSERQDRFRGRQGEIFFSECIIRYNKIISIKLSFMKRFIIACLLTLTCGGILYANETMNLIQGIQAPSPTGVPRAPIGLEQKGRVWELLATIFLPSGLIKSQYVAATSDLANRPALTGNIPFWNGLEFFRPSIITQSGAGIGIGTTNPVTPIDTFWNVLDVRWPIISRGRILITGYNADPLALSTIFWIDNIRDWSWTRFRIFEQTNAVSRGRELFTIKSNGNVGIWTMFPTQALDVNGDIRWRGNMTVNGNVGIGTSTPDTKLTVEGDIKSGWSNTWQLHTPDDGRRDLYFWTANSTNGALTWPITFSSNGNIRSSGQPIINNSSPTIYMQDTDNRSAMLHTNSNWFYVLSWDSNNSLNWAAHNGRWPLQINLENNDAWFGGKVYIPLETVASDPTNTVATKGYVDSVAWGGRRKYVNEGEDTYNIVYIRVQEWRNAGDTCDGTNRNIGQYQCSPSEARTCTDFHWRNWNSGENYYKATIICKAFYYSTGLIE